MAGTDTALIRVPLDDILDASSNGRQQAYTPPDDDPVKPGEIRALAETLYDELTDYFASQYRWQVIGGEGLGGYGPATMDDIQGRRDYYIKESRQLVRKEPLSKQSVRLYTTYSGIQRVEFKAQSEESVKVWKDTYWNLRANSKVLSPVHRRRLSIRLLTDGELFFAYLPNGNGEGGDIRVRTIDPMEIAEFVTHPEDADIVLYYKRVMNLALRRGQLPTTRPTQEPLYYRDWDVTKEMLKEAKDAGFKLPRGAKVAKYRGNEVTVQCVPFDAMGQRGNGLLFAVVSYVRNYRDFLQDRATIVRGLSTYIRDITVQGGSKAVSDLASRFRSSIADSGFFDTKPPDAAGSTMVHNRNLEKRETPPITNAGDAMGDARILRQPIAAGVGITEANLTGDPSIGNLASQYQMEGPQLQNFKDYQLLWQQTFYGMWRFVMEQNGRDVNEWVDIDLPPIVKVPVGEIVTAVFPALERGLIPVEEASRLVLSALGCNQIDTLVKEAKTEREAKEEELKQQQQMMMQQQQMEQPSPEGEGEEEPEEEPFPWDVEGPTVAELMEAEKIDIDGMCPFCQEEDCLIESHGLRYCRECEVSYHPDFFPIEEIKEAHPGHKGRIGKRGGSLPKGKEQIKPVEVPSRDKPDEKAEDKISSLAPKGAARKKREVTPTPEKMSLASPVEIDARMDTELQKYRTPWQPPIDLGGKKLSSRSASRISKNAVGYIDSLSDALTPSTEDVLRRYATDIVPKDMRSLAKVEGLELDAGDMDTLVRSNIDKMVFQEIQSRKRQLGDHGIRHVVGNIENAHNMLDSIGFNDPLSGPLVTQAFVDHDIGYTAGAASEPGEFQATQMHPEVSERYAKANSQYKEIFGDRVDALYHAIKTHGDSNLDWNGDPVLSSIRLADNISLFAKDKLPALFMDVPGAMFELYRLQLSRQGEESSEESLPGIKKRLLERVDASGLDDRIKGELRQAVDEVGDITPKFTLGMLAGEVDSFAFDKDAGVMDVNIQTRPEREILNGLFDMGERQFMKFVGEYDVEGSPSEGLHLVEKDSGSYVVNLKYRQAEEVTHPGIKKLYSLSIRPVIYQAMRDLGQNPDGATKKRVWKSIQSDLKSRLTKEEISEFRRLFGTGRLETFSLSEKEKEFLAGRITLAELRALFGEDSAFEQRVARHSKGSKRGGQFKKKSVGGATGAALPSTSRLVAIEIGEPYPHPDYKHLVRKRGPLDGVGGATSWFIQREYADRHGGAFNVPIPPGAAYGSSTREGHLFVIEPARPRSLTTPVLPSVFPYVRTPQVGGRPPRTGEVTGRTDFEQTISTPPTNIEHIGHGITQSRILEFPDGTKAIFKGWDADPGASFDSGSGEILGYHLSKLFGVNVPETVEMELHTDPTSRESRIIRGIGSVEEVVIEGTAQKWAPEGVGVASWYDDSERREAARSESGLRLAVFDFVTLTSDRHHGNWMIDQNSEEVYAIDNGRIFNNVYGGADNMQPNSCYSEVLIYNMGRRLPQPVLDDLAKITDEDLSTALSRVRLPTHEVTMIKDATRARIDHLLDTKRLPPPSWADESYGLDEDIVEPAHQW